VAHLVIKKGSGKETIFEIQSNSTVIGRGRTCDLILPDISVSRNHALLERSKDGGKPQYIIKDMGSKNAFFVNGVPTKAAKLNESDTINIGKFELRFRKRVDIEDSAGHSRYQPDGREGYLERVTAVHGENVHSTTALSSGELAEKIAAIRRKDDAFIRRAGKPGAEWKPGGKGLAFGKDGISVSGMGMGGRVVVTWENPYHVIQKDGGWFFTLEVNRQAVSKVALSLGDLIQIGGEMFEYKGAD
jgi:pSer/pThr/pTyr-binding forkhead associated (FHA) protein